MGHAGHDLVCPVLRGQLEREVEHRDHHVEPFDRELLLPEERFAEVALESSTSGEAREEPALVVRPPAARCRCRTRSPAAADPLLVVGDVLDLVDAGAAVDLLKLRKDVRQRLARHVNAEQTRRDLFLDIGRQRRDRATRAPRAGSPTGSGAERIEERAARWPCVLYAFTRDTAAATAAKASSTGTGGGAVGSAAGGRRGGARLRPERRFRPPRAPRADARRRDAPQQGTVTLEEIRATRRARPRDSRGTPRERRARIRR